MTRGAALQQFMEQSGLTYEQVNRLGITMEPCYCGLPVCNGWLARNAWLNSDGTAVRKP